MARGSHGGGGISSHMNCPMKHYSHDRRAFLGTNIEAIGNGRWAFGTGSGGID